MSTSRTPRRATPAAAAAPYNVNKARAARAEAHGHMPWPWELDEDAFVFPAELPAEVTEWAAGVQESGNVRALVTNLLIAAERDDHALKGQSQRFETLHVTLHDLVGLLGAYLERYGLNLGESLPSLR